MAVASILVVLNGALSGSEKERRFSACAPGGKEFPHAQSETKESYDGTDWVIVWFKRARAYLAA